MPSFTTKSCARQGETSPSLCLGPHTANAQWTAQFNLAQMTNATAVTDPLPEAGERSRSSMEDMHFYILSIHTDLKFLSKKRYVHFQDQSIKSVISFEIRIYRQLKTWSITRQGIKQALINFRMKHLPRQAV